MSVLLTTASMLAAANVFMTVPFQSCICENRPKSITSGRGFASAAPRTSCFEA